MILEHGDRYGRLKVLKPVQMKDGRTLYRCGCECGSSSMLVSAPRLMNGKVKECARCFNERQKWCS